MRDRNTTVMGICTIVVGVATACMQLFDGDPSTVLDFGAAFAAITAGIGLMKAADSKKADA